MNNDRVLCRISNAKFARMVRHPDREPVPVFAGQRIRSAELVVELFDRKPYRVCRETFSIFQFNGEGRLDVARHDRQQAALVNAMIAPMFDGDKPAIAVVNATERFIAQGGSWIPTALLRDQIEKTALGLLECSAI